MVSCVVWDAFVPISQDCSLWKHETRQMVCLGELDVDLPRHYILSEHFKQTAVITV